MTAAPEIADRLITCVAATKTFNLAGAHVGACITSNAALKRRLDARIVASGLGSYNGFGMIATEAAWRTGEAWLDALLPYLAASRDLFDARIEAAAPGARSMRLDATYLAWVDFSGTGLPPEEVAARVKNRARIFASPGAQFGPGGDDLAALQLRHAAPDPRGGARAAGRRVRGFARREDESEAMKRPVVGVIGNTHWSRTDSPPSASAKRNLRAVADVAGALPLMFAGTPDITDIGALLEVVDGVLLTGARANVHPTRFGTEPHPGHEPYDEQRDALALALVEACVARGVPMFGICRGLQEMNVAFGGTLHPEIRELPGRMNHRMPRLENGEIHPDRVIFADRHDVRLVPGGAFARLLGCETIRVNSLHGQGILEPGARIVVEGVAEDGTIEAIRIADAPGFALGVQWHAEYDPQRNPINRALFQAFGEAVSARQRVA